MAVAADADVFVGRAELVEALAGAPPRGAARIVDTSGIAGMGKTKLVRRLQLEASNWKDPIDLAIPLDESWSPSTAAQSFDYFIQLVESLGARLLGGRDSHRFGELANDLSRVQHDRELMNFDVGVKIHADRARISGADVGIVDIDVDAAGLEAALLGPKSRAVASAFVSRFKRLAKRRAALVTVDGYDAIAGSVLSGWVTALVTQLPNTLVVLTRSPGAAAPAVLGDALEPVQLERFSRADVKALLACQLSGRAFGERLVDLVYDWSDGHPFTADLAARYLATFDDLDPDAFEARLAALPDDYGAQRIEIALEIVRAPGAAELAEAARRLAVTRRFDADLLQALVDAEAMPVSAEEAIERLVRAGVVEPAGAGCHRVHSFIRGPLEQGLAPARRRALHERAARHHYALLCAEEPELDPSARAYDHWYRYEKPEWQALLRDWLYHKRHAAATDADRQRARLDFLRVFLDAFWWWGCYLDFGFCHDLIADWRRARDDDLEWTGDLRLLVEAYPTGYRKEGAAGWPDVRAALVGVRSACGLDGDAGELRGAVERHTRGLLDNFLAHSWRYRAWPSEADRTAAYERALGLYEEAARLFEEGEESWELAWTLFETAELHFDNGARREAQEGWRRAVDIALDEDDWELKANLHRLVADLRWRDGDRAGAFGAHGRAVLHAYLFQCKTASRRPDAYTVSFYREQVERAFERLRSIDASALPDAIERLAGPVRRPAPAADAVAAALADGDPRLLPGLLFPDEPRDDELLEVRSAFTRGVEELADDLLRAAPHRDLAEVEP